MGKIVFDVGNPETPRQLANHFLRPIFTRTSLFRFEEVPLPGRGEPKFPLCSEIFNILGLELINVADWEHDRKQAGATRATADSAAALCRL
jgi:hypothetical protein